MTLKMGKTRKSYSGALAQRGAQPPPLFVPGKYFALSTMPFDRAKKCKLFRL